MTVHHNDPDKFIDNPEDFLQYNRWLISEDGVNNIQTSPPQVSNEQLDGGSNYQVFTNSNIFNYIGSIKYNAQNINFRKDPAKGLVLS